MGPRFVGERPFFTELSRTVSCVYVSLSSLLRVFVCMYPILLREYYEHQIKKRTVCMSTTSLLTHLFLSFAQIALLGFGLVDVPRWLWQRFNEKDALRKCYVRTLFNIVFESFHLV